MDNSMEKRGSIGQIRGCQECMENSAICMEQLSVQARVVLRSEAKQIRLAARNTNLWNNPLVRHVRTNEVSEHMSPSERRELLLQVRMNEVSEHMLQKGPKGALSDRSSERNERQRERRTLVSLSKAKTAQT